MHSELAGWAYFKDLICKYYTYIYNSTYITIFLGYFQMVYTKIIKWTIYIIQFILLNYFFHEGVLEYHGGRDRMIFFNLAVKVFPRLANCLYQHILLFSIATGYIRLKAWTCTNSDLKIGFQDQ